MSSWRDQPLEAVQRARSLEAARQLKSGQIQVPLICKWCSSSWLELLRAFDVLQCLACGRMTDVQIAHASRRQRMAEIIREGVDIDLRPGKHTHGGGTP